MLPFDEQPTGYSPSNALFFAMASRMAYKSPNEIEAEVRDWGLGADFAFFDHADMQGFVAADEQKQVLVFRGTEIARPRDVLVDVRFAKVPGPFGSVHRGFNSAVDALWSDVEAQVEANGPDRRLWITGHSLGAAMAVIAAARFVESGRDVAGVYPLGQPRVGNGAFVREFDGKLRGRCFRIVNSIDPVTRVPTRFLGFRHQAQRVFLTSSGRVIVDAKLWHVLPDSVRTRLKSGPSLKSVGFDQHHFGRYIDVLRAAAD